MAVSNLAVSAQYTNVKDRQTHSQPDSQVAGSLVGSVSVCHVRAHRTTQGLIFVKNLQAPFPFPPFLALEVGPLKSS